MTHPPARDEIRITALRTLAGKNYWARGPVTRLDLSIGAYDEISSADVPGFAVRLAESLPGLVEHACSVGTRGGFLQRLDRGTYAAHIVEHVALELQIALGDDVGYGRTRGADRAGAYVVAFSHRHARVGEAAAREATALVQRVFDGEPARADEALRALDAARAEPDDPPPTTRIDLAICAGPGSMPNAQRVAERAGAAGMARVTIVQPGTMVERGLPYATSRHAIVLDVGGDGVPGAFAEAERREQLYSVMVDGVERAGTLACPASASALQEYARERDRRVVTFHDDEVATLEDVVAALDAVSGESGRRPGSS